jgi:hypothetical protein
MIRKPRITRLSKRDNLLYKEARDTLARPKSIRRARLLTFQQSHNLCRNAKHLSSNDLLLVLLCNRELRSAGTKVRSLLCRIGRNGEAGMPFLFLNCRHSVNG